MSSPKRGSYALPLTIGAFTAAAVGFKSRATPIYDDAKVATTQDARAADYDAANTAATSPSAQASLPSPATAPQSTSTSTTAAKPAQHRPAQVPTATPQQAEVAIMGSW